MLNSNSNSVYNLNSNSTVASSRSSSVSTTSASKSSNSVSAKPKKVTPIIKPLKDRTSVSDVNDKVRDLRIVDKKGNVITAKVQVPGYQAMLGIEDARSIGTMIDDKPCMRTTSVNYYNHLFNTIRNLAVNNQPTHINWKFADNHHEAFRWLTDQASSFLRNKFDAD